MFRFIRVRIGMTRSFHLIHLFTFLLIQSTLLREERLLLRFPYACCKKFQSTLLREERLQHRREMVPAHSFQSTLLREERLIAFSIFGTPFKISIHAPARGATWLCLPCLLMPVSFQSTLLREERLFKFEEVEVVELFQSTLLREERREG